MSKNLIKNKKLKPRKNIWDNMGSTMKLQPFPYQKEAIYHAIHNPNTLMILPVGSGKTPIAIGIFLELRNQGLTDKPGIICVKASLKYQWVEEVKKFSDLRVKAIETPSKARGKKFDEQFEDTDLYVLNYETFKNEKVSSKLLEKGSEVIILDEIHYIGDYKRNKSKALYCFNHLPYKFGLTATPITKNPENIYSIFKMIKPELFPTHGKFASNYLKYRSYGQVSGLKNEKHLFNTLKPYIFVKDGEEIYKQLPELIVNKVYCEMPKPMVETNGRIMERLDEINEQINDYEYRIKDKSKLEFDEKYNKLVTQKLMHQTFAQELVDDPRLLALSDSEAAKEYMCNSSCPKLDILLNLVTDIISSGEKVCIFTKYERMQQLLVEEIQKQMVVKIALVNGSMNSKERHRQINELFAGDHDILIATNAMTEGISLSWCKYLIEYDLAESYALQTQRHGRIRRANSISRTSYVYQILVRDSWDEIQEKIIIKKQKYDEQIKNIK